MEESKECDEEEEEAKLSAEQTEYVCALHESQRNLNRWNYGTMKAKSNLRSKSPLQYN